MYESSEAIKDRFLSTLGAMVLTMLLIDYHEHILQYIIYVILFSSVFNTMFHYLTFPDSNSATTKNAPTEK